MRILFFIPTFTDVTAPLLGVPSLVSYLKKNGVNEIFVKDLNLEILDYLVESAYLEKQAEKVKHDFQHLDNLPDLSGDLIEKYEQFYHLYIFCQLNLYRKLEDYLNKLRRPEFFYDIPGYIFNIKGFFDNCFKLINYDSPMGLDYLFACRLNKEITARDELFQGFYQSMILPRVREIQPDVVGLSVCYSDQFEAALYLAQMIKGELPGIHIVMGGTHLNVLKDNHLSREKSYFSYVDSYLPGEGEVPFLMLLKELEMGGDMSKVSNLIYRRDDTIRVNSMGGELPVNKMPMPDFSCLPLKRYLAPQQLIPYRITRGCYWNRCAFCVHFQTKHFSFKDPELVVEDIKELKKRCASHCFYFVDDSLPKGFLGKFLDILERENLEIDWVGNIRCEEFLTSEFIKRLSKSGCRQLYLGIESGSQRILDLVKKGININTVERIIHDCHQNRISVKMNFIKGLPREDKEDIEETLNFIKRTAKNSDIIAFTPLGIGENTDIAEDPEAFGIEVLEEKDPSRLFLNFRRTKGLTSFEEIDRLYNSHSDLIDRFTFFNRIHHFLLIPKFFEKDFQELTPRLYLISEQVGNYLIRDIQDKEIQVEKKPKFSNNHHPQLLNYNIKQIKKGEDQPLKAQQTIYLYSLLNFEILVDINLFTYQLLTLCSGEKTVREILDHFKIKYPNINPKELERQTGNSLKYLFKYKVIEFV